MFCYADSNDWVGRLHGIAKAMMTIEARLGNLFLPVYKPIGLVSRRPFAISHAPNVERSQSVRSNPFRVIYWLSLQVKREFR
jgi:hypothetical protein